MMRWTTAYLYNDVVFLVFVSHSVALEQRSVFYHLLLVYMLLIFYFLLNGFSVWYQNELPFSKIGFQNI